MDDSFLARLPIGEDLLDSITHEFTKRMIWKADFSVIGAVTSAVLGYYDPETREYRNSEFKGQFEIVACIGNVSEKDGKIFVHAHIVLSGQDYLCFGGHLMAGTKIFAAELSASPIAGALPRREFDPSTGLALWSPD